MSTEKSGQKLSTPKTLFLGLQHTFAMFGATVLVPLITGTPVETALLMAGVGTIIFHICTKGQVPIFLGSSFAFLAGYAVIAPMIGDTPNYEMLPYASGGIVVAGLVYVLFALLVWKFGADRIMRFFPPIVTGPIIIAIGLILAPSAIENCSDNWLLAVVALATIIIFNVWGRGITKIIPIILGIAVAYILALILGQVNFSAIAEAGWVGLPVKSWGIAKFNLSAIISIAPIAVATIVEHIGNVSAAGVTTGKNYIKEPGLHRTLLGDGLATSISAMFGGPANTTYGENNGVLALTGVYDPRVMRIAAVYAIALSFLPKVSAFINTIPVAIIGGVSLMLYGMIATVGVRNLTENNINFANPRNLIIGGLILVLALGFDNIGGIDLQLGAVSLNLSGLAIASIVGILLNIILPGADKGPAKEPQSVE